MFDFRGHPSAPFAGPPGAFSHSQAVSALGAHFAPARSLASPRCPLMPLCSFKALQPGAQGWAQEGGPWGSCPCVCWGLPGPHTS